MSRASAITTTTTATQTTAMPSSRPTRGPKPHAGYNKHVFGRCDVARLQIIYDLVSASNKYSTCLDLSTVLTIAASSTQIVVGGSTTLTATLKVVDADAYGRLGGNAVSGRTVTLQRRAVGTTTWTSVGAMAFGSVTGTYVLAQSPGGATEYRAVFSTPSTEGINGDSSPAVLVNVTRCGAGAVAKSESSIQIQCA